jgi:hypothetical protein
MFSRDGIKQKHCGFLSVIVKAKKKTKYGRLQPSRTLLFSRKWKKRGKGGLY